MGAGAEGLKADEGARQTSGPIPAAKGMRDVRVTRVARWQS
jgi:hypothetical protein